MSSSVFPTDIVFCCEAVDIVLLLLAMSANDICRLPPNVYFYGDKDCTMLFATTLPLICKEERIRTQNGVDPVTQY